VQCNCTAKILKERGYEISKNKIIVLRMNACREEKKWFDERRHSRVGIQTGFITMQG